MTPRERILAAIDHRETDRIPIDLGSSLVTSITKAAYVPAACSPGPARGVHHHL